MKNLKIFVEQASGTLEHVCKVTTYLPDRAHREPVYNTVARYLRGVAPWRSSAMETVGRPKSA